MIRTVAFSIRGRIAHLSGVRGDRYANSLGPGRRGLGCKNPQIFRNGSCPAPRRQERIYKAEVMNSEKLTLDQILILQALEEYLQEVGIRSEQILDAHGRIRPDPPVLLEDLGIRSKTDYLGLDGAITKYFPFGATDRFSQPPKVDTVMKETGSPTLQELIEVITLKHGDGIHANFVLPVLEGGEVEQISQPIHRHEVRVELSCSAWKEASEGSFYVYSNLEPGGLISLTTGYLPYLLEGDHYPPYFLKIRRTLFHDLVQHRKPGSERSLIRYLVVLDHPQVEGIIVGHQLNLKGKPHISGVNEFQCFLDRFSGRDGVLAQIA